MPPTQADRCSVIIPTRNRRDRLLRTLATVQAQTYPHVEIVVSDDGSTDGTSHAVEALNDRRIVLTRSSRSAGVSNARNRAAAVATGEFIAVCDDDDLWVPTKIEGQIEQLRSKSAQWCYCFAVAVDENLVPQAEARTVPGDDFMRVLSSQNPIPGGCSSVVCHRELYDRCGGFDPEFSMFADWDLWIRLAASGPPSVWKDVGTIYVTHDGQMSQDMDGVTGELDQFRAKHAEHRRTHGRIAVEQIDIWVAVQMFASGNYREAFSFVLQKPTLRERIYGLRSLSGAMLRLAGLRNRKSSMTPQGAGAVRLVYESLQQPAAGPGRLQAPGPTLER